MTPGRCSRGARAATFAAVCVLLAATGHILMSGRAVPGWTLSLAFVGTVSLAWILAGRERGLFAVTVATIAVQSVLHRAFSWSQPDSGPPANAPHAAMDHAHMDHSAMDHSAMGHSAVSHPVTGHSVIDHSIMGHSATGLEIVSQAGTAIAEAPAAHDMTGMSSSFGMLSAHLLAALLSGLWMAYGEQAAFRLLRALPLGLFRPLRLLIAAVVPVGLDRPLLRTFRAGDERAPRRLLLAHSVISRGPPQALAVL
ncbi:hypothetical protein ACFVZW_06510 [Streptomyces sp. NPDC059567]|uniref:hypothetical protein n=1 Tax=Streptomyces sp. NPDC059567 TaxID=3346867 RepID=UPI0036898790